MCVHVGRRVMQLAMQDERNKTTNMKMREGGLGEWQSPCGDNSDSTLRTNIAGLQGFASTAANLVCVSYADLEGSAGMSQKAPGAR